MSAKSDFDINEFSAYMKELLDVDQNNKFDKIISSTAVLIDINFFDFRYITQNRQTMLTEAIAQLEALKPLINKVSQKFDSQMYNPGTYIDFINGDGEYHISYNLFKYINNLFELIKIINECTKNQHTFFNSVIFNKNDEESNFYNIYMVKKLYEISVKTIFPVFNLILKMKENIQKESKFVFSPNDFDKIQEYIDEFCSYFDLQHEFIDDKNSYVYVDFKYFQYNDVNLKFFDDKGTNEFDFKPICDTISSVYTLFKNLLHCCNTDSNTHDFIGYYEKRIAINNGLKYDDTPGEDKTNFERNYNFKIHNLFLHNIFYYSFAVREDFSLNDSFSIKNFNDEKTKNPTLPNTSIDFDYRKIKRVNYPKATKLRFAYGQRTLETNIRFIDDSLLKKSFQKTR